MDHLAPLPAPEGLTVHGPLPATAARLATRDFVVVAPQLPIPGDLWRR